jgi:hypothetical protein
MSGTMTSHVVAALMAVARREPDLYFGSIFHGKYEGRISRRPAPYPIQSQQMAFSGSSMASMSEFRGLSVEPAPCEQA